MRLHLHIERLVLDGVNVPFASRGAMRAAVEQELARLAGTGAIAPEIAAGVAVPSVRAPQISIERTPAPAPLGRAIAGAVWAAVGRRR
jgi:hypothetical protein